MKFIASISLIAVFIFGIIKMRKASSEIKSIWFRELSNSNKLKVTSKVKENWKKTIILLAITIAAMLIIISLFIGKTHNNDNLVSIVMLIVSIIVLFFIIYYNKKFKKELNNFKNQI